MRNKFKMIRQNTRFLIKSVPTGWTKIELMVQSFSKITMICHIMISKSVFRIIGLVILLLNCCDGKVRNYYLSVEDVEWDYAPTNTNVITGKPVTEGR